MKGTVLATPQTKQEQRARSREQANKKQSKKQPPSAISISLLINQR
jgi:hypothetical protein